MYVCYYSATFKCTEKREFLSLLPAVKDFFSDLPDGDVTLEPTELTIRATGKGRWESWIEDLIVLSEESPATFIECSEQGEDDTDGSMTIAFVQEGKYYLDTVKVVRTFPVFDPSKLHIRN